jgi:hypothetical protein
MPFLGRTGYAGMRYQYVTTKPFFGEFIFVTELSIEKH